MTSAARPTWLPAMGGGAIRDTGRAIILQKSSKDLSHHTKMKLRQPGQNAPSDLSDREAFIQKLNERENSKRKGRVNEPSTAPSFSVEIDEDESIAKRRKLLETNPDADDDDDEDEDEGVGGANDEDGNDEDDDDDDDDEDDTAELLAELEKIKKERAEEKERLERDKKEQEAKIREEAMLTGNPLLNVQNGSSSAVAVRDFSVRRRWDDDVIFKNQAKGQDEKPKKRFINDLLRSDFHRKFMSKYVR